MLPYPQIDPVFLRLGPVAFRWYGLMYAVGFIAANWLIPSLSKRRGVSFTANVLSDLLFYVVVGVVAGGRLGYVFIYQPVFYLSHPLKMLAVWEGGMSFHGGMIGAILAGLLFCKKHKRDFYEVADVAIVSVPIGLGLGRIANFINGELFGRVTRVPWCMVFPDGGDVCRHPSQLYQAVGEGAVLFFILWRLFHTNAPRGVVFWAFILCYGLSRFLIEFFREPDLQMGLFLEWLSMGQLLSLPMILLSGIMIRKLYARRG